MYCPLSWTTTPPHLYLRSLRLGLWYSINLPRTNFLHPRSLRRLLRQSVLARTLACATASCGSGGPLCSPRPPTWLRESLTCGTPIIHIYCVLSRLCGGPMCCLVRRVYTRLNSSIQYGLQDPPSSRRLTRRAPTCRGLGSTSNQHLIVAVGCRGGCARTSLLQRAEGAEARRGPPGLTKERVRLAKCSNRFAHRVTVGLWQTH